MPCHNAYPELVGDHEHQHVIHTELFLEIFSVPRVAETLGHHGLLVDRSGHQHVDVPVLDVLDGAFQRPDRGFRRLRCGLSRFNEHIVRQTVDDVDFLRPRILGALDHVGVHLIEIVNQLAVKSENL